MDSTANKSPQDGCTVSSFACAVILFVFVNYLAWSTHFCNAEATNFPEKSWTSWAISDFLSQKKAPDLVFLGSSLMLVPLAGVDADYLGTRLDGSQHHKSLYFENQVHKLTNQNITTFNFALPGEMPSDADMITEFLLRHGKRPKVIVYGVGPRDFMDNLLPSPSATDPFRSLVRFGSLDEQAALFFPDWQQRLSYELGKAFYLYGTKEDINTDLNRRLAFDMNKYVPAPKHGKKFTIFDRRALLPDYRVTELNPGEAYFRPHKPGEMEHFSDNLIEYQKRYKILKWDTFLTQMQSFCDLLNVARARDIHVVVIAMPITDINKSLLPAYAWNLYRESVKAYATAKGATFIDLEASNKFALSDFMDTVHLHTGGGAKMLDMLSQAMTSDKSTTLALRLTPVRTAHKAKASDRPM